MMAREASYLRSAAFFDLLDSYVVKMGGSIRIAAAAPEEFEWCAQVMASSEPWITFGRDLAACRSVLTRPGSELFVASEKGFRAGFILLAAYGLGASPYVASIAVAPEARGRGVGSEMLRFAEEHFAGRGHLFLLVSSFNPRAQELYRRSGYEFIGELKDYLVAGHSDFIMQKRIA